MRFDPHVPVPLDSIAHAGMNVRIAEPDDPSLKTRKKLSGIQERTADDVAGCIPRQPNDHRAIPVTGGALVRIEWVLITNRRQVDLDAVAATLHGVTEKNQGRISLSQAVVRGENQGRSDDGP